MLLAVVAAVRPPPRVELEVADATETEDTRAKRAMEPKEERIGPSMLFRFRSSDVLEVQTEIQENFRSANVKGGLLQNDTGCVISQSEAIEAGSSLLPL
mmetsp:Transcript_17532/g.50182  ORF Transcript_17532/g.50182 Transcript_17532/m.50182 type:complete len:99 (+) Transcript_17532:835-1131(+)